MAEISSVIVEQYMLGQILVRPESLPTVLQLIGPEDFQNKEYRLVVEACADLAAAGLPIGTEAILARLREQHPGEHIAHPVLLLTLLREAIQTFQTESAWIRKFLHG